MQDKRPSYNLDDDETMVFHIDESLLPKEEAFIYRNSANGYGASVPRNYANNYGRGPAAPAQPPIHAYNTDYRKASLEQNMDRFDALASNEDRLPVKKERLGGLIATAILLSLAIMGVMARFISLYLGW